MHLIENDSMSKNMIDDSFREQIREDNAYFKQVFNSIPPSFYFDSEAKELLAENDTEMTSVEKKGQKAIGAKAAKKAFNLDPSKVLTVTDVQSLLAKKESDEKRPQHYSANSNLKRLEELQVRLQTRLEELRDQRKAATGKDAARSRFTRKQSKLKQQLKKTANKLKIAKDKGEHGNKVVKSPASAKGKPVFNKEGNVVFSKFDFINSGDGDKPSASSGKNYKKLLQATEKQRQKLELLEQSDKNEANAVKEQSAWKKAVQKASGVKVKDNPELLKKAIKRKEKLKNKSRKQWDERSKQVQQKMDKRQEKRKRNIGKKKQSRIDKKVNKAKKKGRIIPGF